MQIRDSRAEKWIPRSRRLSFSPLRRLASSGGVARRSPLVLGAATAATRNRRRLAADCPRQLGRLSCSGLARSPRDGVRSRRSLRPRPRGSRRDREPRRLPRRRLRPSSRRVNGRAVDPSKGHPPATNLTLYGLLIHATGVVAAKEEAARRHRRRHARRPQKYESSSPWLPSLTRTTRERARPHAIASSAVRAWTLSPAASSTSQLAQNVCAKARQAARSRQPQLHPEEPQPEL